MPMELDISPAIWQSYINAILECLQSRRYCEAIMDDLLIFAPSKGSHFDKLEDLLKALKKNGLQISLKNASCSELNYNIWTTPFSLEIKRVCVKPLTSRIETIQKLKPRKMIKEC